VTKARKAAWEGMKYQRERCHKVIVLSSCDIATDIQQGEDDKELVDRSIKTRFYMLFIEFWERGEEGPLNEGPSLRAM